MHKSLVQNIHREFGDLLVASIFKYLPIFRINIELRLLGGWLLHFNILCPCGGGVCVCFSVCECVRPNANCMRPFYVWANETMIANQSRPTFATGNNQRMMRKMVDIIVLSGFDAAIWRCSNTFNSILASILLNLFYTNFPNQAPSLSINI